MTENKTDSAPIESETHSAFVATDATTGQSVGMMVEQKTFRAASEADDMPLPTNPQTVFLGGLFGLGVLAVLYVAADIVLPVILAVILKLLLQPLVRTLERAHVPRPLGAILSVLLVLLVFGGTISLLAGPAAGWAAKLPEAIPKLRDSLVFLKEPIAAVQGMMSRLQSMAGGEQSVGLPQASAVRPASLVGALLSGSATVTSGLFTTLLILFYLLVSGEIILLRVVEILPTFKDKRQAVELSLHIERDVSAYLLTVSCINAMVGTATGVVMWLCGVANPVLWGAVAFVLNFVPILGAMVGIVVFLMASVLSLGVSWWALLPVGLYFGIHIIEGEIATPMFLARRFTINPIALILALIFWYWMWGVPGAILAVPLLAITKILCDDLRPLRAIGHLLEG
jgi:predicted PurR-regulated permease PerM